MLLTLFLLGLLYVVLVVALLAAGAGLVTMVVIIGGAEPGQLFFSDKLALSRWAPRRSPRRRRRGCTR